MQKVRLCDRVVMHLRDTEGVRLSCPQSNLPEDEDNLAAKAAYAFLDHVKMLDDRTVCGVDILLLKRIPVAAGLGGGSSDAAAVLSGLNRLMGQPLAPQELAAIGVQLGADVPFFLDSSSACWAEGIGEQLTSVPTISSLPLVLVNPGFGVSTKAVYEKYALTRGRDSINLENSRIESWKRAWVESISRQEFPATALLNDLEPVTASMHAEIKNIKTRLMACGAEAAMVSGSGPTVFAVFADSQQAQKCCQALKKLYRSVFFTSPAS